MSNRGVSTIFPIDVQNQVMTQLITANRDRVSVEVMNETSGIIYVGFGEKPNDITTMGKVLSNGLLIADADDQTEQALWCYHAQGADIISTTAITPGDNAIKVREAI